MLKPILFTAVLLASVMALAVEIQREHCQLYPNESACQAQSEDDEAGSLDPNDCSRGIDESNQESCADQVVSQ